MASPLVKDYKFSVLNQTYEQIDLEITSKDKDNKNAINFNSVSITISGSLSAYFDPDVLNFESSSIVNVSLIDYPHGTPFNVFYVSMADNSVSGSTGNITIP